MNDFVIGQSYYLRFDPKLWAAMQPYPPLGSLYAASVLRAKGYDVAFFDAMLAEGESEWEINLRNNQPKIAVIYEDNFNYLSKMCLSRMREAAMRMIKSAREMGCKVIVAGSDASDHAPLYLKAGADYILLGEGEETLVELSALLVGNIDDQIESILGLAYLSDGQVKINPRRPDLRNLDELPFPAWDLVDLERYRDIWRARHGYFSINLVTTRGCPYHCNWCAKPIWGQRYNTRSPENVIAEITWLNDLFSPDHIWFVDDIFGLKPGWLQRFAALVQEEQFRIPYKCLNRADLLLRPGEIEALSKSGCQIVWIGAESGSQKILDAMEKGIRVEQIYEAARRLHNAGIQVGFFLQFGYPGENREDIEKTIQLVRRCQPDDIGISVSYPLPGTPFFERVKHELGEKQNWVDSQDLAMLYKGPYSTHFYRQLHRVVHKEFRVLKQHQFSNSPDRNHSLRVESSKYKILLPAIRKILDKISLPVDRLILSLYEHLPHKGLKTIPPELSPEEAAQPTPSERHGSSLGG
jgi:radical SAM superfamily enzyme YgiQ (UPF0313 family)